MRLPVYLDYNATTPVDPRVVEAMLPYFNDQYGNASSKGHAYGWAADEAVEQARQQVAALIGAEPRDILFTSGATEAANAAIKGVAEAYASKGRHIVTVQTEHKAVRDTCRHVERTGLSVTYLPVRPDGTLDAAALESALRDDTILVSVMWANNETGVVHPIQELADLVRRRGILFMTDATQAAGKMPVSVEHADLLLCSAHKFYGPKGVGALYVRRRNPHVRLSPLIDGGGQEQGLRGGTLNVPGIVGMGKAAELARQEVQADSARLERLRNRFEAALAEDLLDIRINGLGAARLAQTSNVTFGSVKATDLIASLRDVAVSTRSACASGMLEPSHVLTAIGLSDEEAGSTIRFSMGRFTTEEEVEFTARHVVEAVRSLQETPAPSTA